MDLTPKLEIEARISKFQQKLTLHQLDGAIIVLNSDIFYFTGTVQNQKYCPN